MTRPTKRWLWWIFSITSIPLVPFAIIIYWSIGDSTWIGSAREIARAWWNEIEQFPWKERPL